MLDKIDYTQSGFILSIERNNIKGYVSINAEFYTDEDGLDFTGNYIVYLLHPSKGSITFTLEPDAQKKWVIARDVVEIEDILFQETFELREDQLQLEQDILDEIIQAIDSRRHPQGATANVANN